MRNSSRRPSRNSLETACNNHLRRDGNYFDLLRLLGASLVFFSHSFAIYGKYEPSLIASQGGFKEISFGTLGVSLFFLVSGFLIADSWNKAPRVVPFLMKRVLRLYPGFLVCALVTIVVIGAAISSYSLANYFTLVLRHSLKIALNVMGFTLDSLPGVFHQAPIPQMVNGALWTLKMEVQCYLVLMLAGMTIGLNRKVVLIATLYFIVFWKRAFLPQCSADLLYIHAGSFILGSCLYVFKRYVPLDRRWFFLCVAILCYLSFKKVYFLPAYLVATAYSCIYIAFVKIPLLKLGRFGDCSYGTYIYAWPIQQAFAGWFHYDPLHFAFYMISGFLTTLAVAVLSWHLVEKPALGLKGKLWLIQDRKKHLINPATLRPKGRS